MCLTARQNNCQQQAMSVLTIVMGIFRRRLGALVNSVVASELVQDICTGMVSADLDDGN